MGITCREFALLGGRGSFGAAGIVSKSLEAEIRGQRRVFADD
jgi:hypothetical protein